MLRQKLKVYFVSLFLYSISHFVLAKVEKTEFDVKLVSFDSSSKIKLIKEVRALTGMGLQEVTTAPAPYARFYGYANTLCNTRSYVPYFFLFY